MADKIFADGIRFYRPREGAPNFIKGQISIEVDRFKEFLKKHQGPKYINIDLKLSKDGNLYLELNTFKKKEQPPSSITSEGHNDEQIDVSGIPF